LLKVNNRYKDEITHIWNAAPEEDFDSQKLVSFFYLFCLFVTKKVTKILLNFGGAQISSLPCETQRTVGITNLSKSEFQKEILLFFIIALNRDAVSCPIAQHFPAPAQNHCPRYSVQYRLEVKHCRSESSVSDLLAGCSNSNHLGTTIPLSYGYVDRVSQRQLTAADTIRHTIPSQSASAPMYQIKNPVRDTAVAPGAKNRKKHMPTALTRSVRFSPSCPNLQQRYLRLRHLQACGVERFAECVSRIITTAKSTSINPYGKVIRPNQRLS
jgi:hypothetical protein